MNTFEIVLVVALVSIIVGLSCSIATYLLYPKIVKQVQRTVAELEPAVQAVEAKVETAVQDVAKKA
jgi:biopolymer transport protein ExbB/TolQ